MTTSTPKATFNNTIHRYDFREEQITITLDRFDQGRDGDIRCELEITYLGKQLKPPTRTNLLAERTISSLVKSLAERTKGADIDWDSVLGKVVTNSIARYRQGDPPVDLTKISGWRSRPRFMLFPFLESSGDTILFADGGSGKSTIALLMGVMVATGCPLLPNTVINETGNVLYLDYEADDITHAERLTAVRNAFDPPLEIPEGSMIYKRMYAPLHEAVDDLLRYIGEHEIKLVIVDSLGRARGGAPEGSEETLRVFNALARLQVPRLLIDHLSKDAIFNGNGNSRPIGSIYTHNNARLTWSLTAAESHLEDQPGYGYHAIQMINHKNNNGRLHGRRSYSLTYYNDDAERLTQIYVSEIDPSTVPDFLKLQPIYQRARMMLEEQGEATSDQLAEWLNAKKAEVERQLVAHPELFWRETRDAAWNIIRQESIVSEEQQPQFWQEEGSE